jgi:hypothetical protein
MTSGAVKVSQHLLMRVGDWRRQRGAQSPYFHAAPDPRYPDTEIGSVPGRMRSRYNVPVRWSISWATRRASPRSKTEMWRTPSTV